MLSNEVVCKEVVYLTKTGRPSKRGRICGLALPCSEHGNLVGEIVKSLVGKDVKVELPNEPLMLSLGNYSKQAMEPIAFIKPAEVPDYASSMAQLPMPHTKEAQINLGMWNMMKANGSEGQFVTWGGDQVNVNFEARAKRDKNTVMDVAASLMEASDVMCIFDTDVFFYLLRKLEKRGLEVAGILCLNNIKKPENSKTKKGYQYLPFPEASKSKFQSEPSKVKEEPPKLEPLVKLEEGRQAAQIKSLEEPKEPEEQEVQQVEKDSIFTQFNKFLEDPEVEACVEKDKEKKLKILSKEFGWPTLDEAGFQKKADEFLKTLVGHGDASTWFFMKGTNALLRSNPECQKLYESFNQVCGKTYGPAYASFYGLKGEDAYVSETGYGIFFNPNKVKLVKAGSDYSHVSKQKHELHSNTKRFNIFSVANHHAFSCVFEKNGCQFNVVTHFDKEFSSFVDDRTFVCSSGDEMAFNPVEQSDRTDAIEPIGKNRQIFVSRKIMNRDIVVVEENVNEQEVEEAQERKIKPLTIRWLDGMTYDQTKFQAQPTCKEDFCFQRMDVDLELRKMISAKVGVTKKMTIKEYNEEFFNLLKALNEFIMHLADEDENQQDNLAVLFKEREPKENVLVNETPEGRQQMDHIKQFLVKVYPNERAPSNHPPFLRSFITCK